MSKLAKRLTLVVALAIAGATGVLAWTANRVYYRYSSSIFDIVRGVPTAEREPTESFKRAVDRVHPRGVLPFVVMRLAGELVEPERQVARSVREAAWQKLLPLQLSEAEILSLYAHFMPAEGGTGLEYGAREYFSKAPASLTYEECLTLVIVAQSPRAYSPRNHPERVREALVRFGE